jgi:hypothetical protein
MPMSLSRGAIVMLPSSRAISQECPMNIDRLDPGPRLSRAVLHGPTIYLAGLTADDVPRGPK